MKNYVVGILLFSKNESEIKNQLISHIQWNVFLNDENSTDNENYKVWVR